MEGWGRVGDVAIVALDRLDEPVGAAWYRLFTEEPGYGFVAPDVPELSIAVYPECRGRHVGGLLLGSLVSRARADGYRAISLSVAVANPARRLYVRHGFEEVPRAEGDEAGDSVTMILDLTADPLCSRLAIRGRPAERMLSCPSPPISPRRTARSPPRASHEPARYGAGS